MFGYVAATLIFFSFLFKQIIMDNQYDMERIKAYVFNWQVALKDVVTSIILSIIVIVVAVPEGLPMMIAIVLSLNMRRLLRAKVLVRKLLGIEAAGSIDILFVDKTGTLTKGIFEPQMFVSGNCQSYQVSEKPIFYHSSSSSSSALVLFYYSAITILIPSLLSSNSHSYLIIRTLTRFHPR